MRARARDAQNAQFEAPDQLPAQERLELDTSGLAAESVAAAATWLAATREA